MKLIYKKILIVIVLFLMVISFISATTIVIDNEDFVNVTKINNVVIQCSVNATNVTDNLEVQLSYMGEEYYTNDLFKYSIQNATQFIQHNFPINNLEDGTYSFKCVSYIDNSTFESGETYYIIDTTKPTINLNYLSYDREDSNLPVQATLTYSVYDEHLWYCEYTTSDIDFIFIETECDEPITHNFNSFGQHTITIKAFDVLGNERSSISEYINIDDTLPPTILIDKPRTSSDLDESHVELIIKTNEEASCFYKLDEGSYFEMLGDTTHTSSIEMYSQDFTLRFKCEDVFGNIAETDVEDFHLTFNPETINNTNGTLRVSFDEENVYIQKGFNLIDFNVVDEYGQYQTASNINIFLSGVDDYTLTKILSYDVGRYKIELKVENLSSNVVMEIVVNGNSLVSKELIVITDNNGVVVENKSIFSSIGDAIKRFFDAISRLFTATEKIDDTINKTKDLNI